MIKILADASLPYLEEAFPAPFRLSRYYQIEEVEEQLSGQDILLCRATLAVTSALLSNKSIRLVATATSGIDHIDLPYLQQNNIQLFQAKGINAPAVVDYVLACIAFLITYKPIKLKTVGIIGAGNVGTLLHQRLQKIGYQTVVYDPLKASRDTTFKSCNLDSLSNCELICIHPNLHQETPFPSYQLINEGFLRRLAPQTVLINASRGEIVDETALSATLNPLSPTFKPLSYCSDVFENEPFVNPILLEQALVTTPHIAGHSLDAKQQAVLTISRQLHAYFKLNCPSFDSLISSNSNSAINLKSNNWCDQILSLYNPFLETQAFKKGLQSGEPIQTLFLRLRQAHCSRRDFIYM